MAWMMQGEKQVRRRESPEHAAKHRNTKWRYSTNEGLKEVAEKPVVETGKVETAVETAAPVTVEEPKSPEVMETSSESKPDRTRRPKRQKGETSLEKPDFLDE